MGAIWLCADGLRTLRDWGKLQTAYNPKTAAQELVGWPDRRGKRRQKKTEKKPRKLRPPTVPTKRSGSAVRPVGAFRPAPGPPKDDADLPLARRAAGDGVGG
ncbi:hypothetical protein NDU88_002129 [Pleurodeles waltl]|uniref:Uncharacterized protein n=1 Tax=Pleurodeles waltl TaxID=8319 RepID=A0AAV7Q900_PLEWA|nr:hypothetical protein NDU88_002129 [Pleurodeles waltl]